MARVDLSTRGHDGQVVVELRGEFDLAAAAPQRQVARMLSLTRLIDAFSVHASVDEAAGGTTGGSPQSGRQPRTLSRSA